MAADGEGLLERDLADYEREGSEILSEDDEEDDYELYESPCSRTDLVFASDNKMCRKRARQKKNARSSSSSSSKVAKAAMEDLPSLIKDESQNNITNKENLKNDQRNVVMPQEIDVVVDFTQAVSTLSQELSDVDRFTMAHSKEERSVTDNDDKRAHDTENDDNDCSSSDEEVIVTDDKLVTIAPIKVVDGKIVVLMDNNNNPLEPSKDPNISKDSNISNIDIDQEDVDVMEASSSGSPTENGGTVTSGDTMGPIVNEGTTTTTTTTTTTDAVDGVLEDEDLTQAVDEGLMENSDGVLTDGGVVTKGTNGGDLTGKMDEDSAEVIDVGLSETMDQDLTEPAAVEDTGKTLEDPLTRNETETDNDPVLKMDTLDSEKDPEEMKKTSHNEDLSNGEGATDLKTNGSQGQESEEEKDLQQKDENSQQHEEEGDKDLKENEDSNQQEQDDDGGVNLQEEDKDLQQQREEEGEEENILNGGESDSTQTGTVGAAINSNNNGSTINDAVTINSNNDGPTANDGNEDDIGYEITPSLVQKFQSCSESQEPIVTNKSTTTTKSDEMGFFDFEISESQVNNMNKPESQKLPPLAPPSPLAPPPSLPLPPPSLPPLAPPPSLPLPPPSLPPLLSTFPLPLVNESQDHLSDLNDAPMVPSTTSQTRSCPRQSSPPPLPPSLSPHHSPPAKRRKTNRLEISRGGSEIRKLSPLINRDSMKLPGWDLREKIPQRQYFLRIVIPEGVGKSTSSGRLVFDGEEGPVWYHRFCVAGKSGSYQSVSHCKSNPPHPCATVLQNKAPAASSTRTAQPQAAITSSSISIPSSSVAPLPSTTNLIGRSSLPVPPPSAPPTIDMSIYDDTVKGDGGGVSQCTNKIVIESDDERVSSPDSADLLINTRCPKDSEETVPPPPTTTGKTLATAVNTQSTLNTLSLKESTSTAAENLPSASKSTSPMAAMKDPSSSKTKNTFTTASNTSAARGTTVTKKTSPAPTKGTTSTGKKNTGSAAKKNTGSVPTKDTTATSTKDTTTTTTMKKSSPGARSITSSVATSVSEYVVSKSRALEIMREFYIKQAYHNYGEKN